MFAKIILAGLLLMNSIALIFVFTYVDAKFQNLEVKLEELIDDEYYT